MKVSEVKVTHYSKGKMLGFADVGFSFDEKEPKAVHMIWKGFKLFQGDNGGVQIALPSRKENKKDDNGRDVYSSVIIISRAKEDEPKTRADDFFKYLQTEVETAYKNTPLPSSNTGQNSGGGSVPAGNTGTVGDDDIPF